jgi:hypothetical protein
MCDRAGHAFSIRGGIRWELAGAPPMVMTARCTAPSGPACTASPPPSVSPPATDLTGVSSSGRTKPLDAQCALAVDAAGAFIGFGADELRTPVRRPDSAFGELAADEVGFPVVGTLASRYSRNAVSAVSANGRILDLKNVVSRMVIVPTCRSTSARFRRASFPNRSPAQ